MDTTRTADLILTTNGNQPRLPSGRCRRPGTPDHPVNLQIFYWFEIGGWNTQNGTVCSADPAAYADSDIGWNGVPETKWYNTYNLETILGGRGYAF